MNENLVRLFTQNLSDTEELLDLLEQLNFVKNNLYHSQSGLITQKMRKSLTATLERIFQQAELLNLEPQDETEQRFFLDQLIQYLKSLPVVRITLAFTPTLEFIRKMNEVITVLSGKKVILDIGVNHRIVAGCLLDCNGKFRDYSEQQRIEAILRTKLITKEKTEVDL